MREKENRWIKKEWGVQGSIENYFGEGGRRTCVNLAVFVGEF